MTKQDVLDRTTVEVADRASSRLIDAGWRAARQLASAVRAGHPAGGTVVVADASGELLRITTGWSCLVNQRIPTCTETLYDLASLTKVICTATLCVLLAQREQWTLEDAVVNWLPSFPNRQITLRALLTHTSGLPAHLKLYQLAGGPPAMRAAVYAEAAKDHSPSTVCYSDLGFMLLGWALEECSGRPLDELFRELVAKPLGMTKTRFRPTDAERPLIAATELDGDQRLQPGLVWGTVHDGNAWALGGVAGHAGLFGPADDLCRFASALLAPESHPVLSEPSLVEMTRRQAGTYPEVRGLGWRLDARDWGAWPPTTFWHTGFTGTSLLVAPEADLAVVGLLGGVHPRRQPERLDAIRRGVHAELAGSLT